MEAQQGVWGSADIPWPSGVCQLAVTHGDEILYVVFSLLDVLTLGFFYIKKNSALSLGVSQVLSHTFQSH